MSAKRPSSSNHRSSLYKVGSTTFIAQFELSPDKAKDLATELIRQAAVNPQDTVELTLHGGGKEDTVLSVTGAFTPTSGRDRRLRGDEDPE